MKQVLNREEVVDMLEDILGEERVGEGDGLEMPVSRLLKWAAKRRPDAVVRPRDLVDLVKTVKFSADHDVPLLHLSKKVGGLREILPTGGGILLDYGDMKAPPKVDAGNGCLTVLPGNTWKECFDAAQKAGLTLRLAPSAGDSLPVGDWVAMGGAGPGSLKYGGLASHLRALQVVAADGSVHDLGRPEFSTLAGGFDLLPLFVGSQSAFGLVSEVTFALHPPPESFSRASFVVPSLQKAGEVMFALSSLRPTPYHIFLGDGRQYAFEKELGWSVPQGGAVLTAAYDGTAAEVDEAVKVCASAATAAGGTQLGDAESGVEWDKRFLHGRVESLGTGGELCRILVPARRLTDILSIYEEEAAKCERVRVALTASIPEAGTALVTPYYGWTGESEEGALEAMGLARAVSRHAVERDGWAAGFGFWTPSHIEPADQEALSLVFALKEAFDPDNILNPGQMEEAGALFGLPIPHLPFDVGLKLLKVARKATPRFVRGVFWDEG